MWKCAQGNMYAQMCVFPGAVVINDYLHKKENLAKVLGLARSLRSPTALWGCLGLRPPGPPSHGVAAPLAPL